MTRCFWCACLLLFVAICAFAAPAQERKSTAPIASSARLAAAKSAFVRRIAGSEVPYNVVQSSLEGWGRFALVDTPEQADIVLEVFAPAAAGPGVSASVAASGQGPSANRGVSDPDVRLAVYDRKTRVLLWSGTERPKSAWRKKTADDNLVEAAERLVSRFREHIEPVSGKNEKEHMIV